MSELPKGRGNQIKTVMAIPRAENRSLSGAQATRFVQQVTRSPLTLTVYQSKE
jgi:hypothetical protein